MIFSIAIMIFAFTLFVIFISFIFISIIVGAIDLLWNGIENGGQNLWLNQQLLHMRNNDVLFLIDY